MEDAGGVVLKTDGTFTVLAGELRAVGTLRFVQGVDQAHDRAAWNPDTST